MAKISKSTYYRIKKEEESKQNNHRRENRMKRLNNALTDIEKQYIECMLSPPREPITIDEI
jgi:hypothetical protein